jgi:hypothetical protein
MAILRTGSFTESPATGRWDYGRGAPGGLVVDAGSTLAMTSAAGIGP